MAGLPAPDAAVELVLAEAQGKSEALPVRGLLVTTLAYVVKDPEGGFRLHDADPGFQFTGYSETTIEDHAAEAYKILAKHREWLRRFQENPYTTSSAIHATLPSAFQRGTEASLDYLTEAISDRDALDTLKQQVLVGIGGQAREVRKRRLVKKYLDTVQRRVKNRLDSRDRDSTPPPAWRDAARRYIDAYIER
jgi:hypothetical protein